MSQNAGKMVALARPMIYLTAALTRLRSKELIFRKPAAGCKVAK